MQKCCANKKVNYTFNKKNIEKTYLMFNITFYKTQYFDNKQNNLFLYNNVA